MPLRLVALGYVAVALIAAALLYSRRLLERADPASASGGMFAFGDILLHLFLGCLFLIPTAFLIWILAKSPAGYETYARFLLGVGVSAPLGLAGFLAGQNHLPDSVGWIICLFRVFGSPVVLLCMAASLWAARSGRARRLISYALLLEFLTLCATVVAFVYS
jgi:hypothetical protein